MDKQQEVEDIISKALRHSLMVCNNCSPKPDGVIAYIQSAIEAHEAQQSPTDAVAFVEWIEQSEYRRGIIADKWYTKGSSLSFTTTELYKLFNLSGAAPQAAAPEIELTELPEPIGNFILAQKDLPGQMAPDGMYWHYSKVCSLLTRYGKQLEAPAAGPVWVNAKDFKFTKGQYYHAQYSGAESLRGPYTWIGTGNLHQEAFWWSNPGHAPIAENDFDRLVILDESPPQVFTREQVADILVKYDYENNCAPGNPLSVINDWFNSNYPPSK